MGRKARIKLDGHATYHCISRVVDRRFIFNVVEKKYLTDTMRMLERFTGCQVLTHCVMSNHFHILLEVPEKGEVSDEVFTKRMVALHGKEEGKRWREIFLDDTLRRQYAEERERLELRMCDLSAFMKELKQRFTQWYNRRKKRTGTLWEERFKSVLVEDVYEALGTIAEYIDLNPVRAGICKDPKSYRWCGYAGAVAGDPAAVKGFGRLLVLLEWGRSGVLKEGVSKGKPLALFLQRYRDDLFEYGGSSGDASRGERVRPGIDRKSIQRVIKKKGKLSRYELLRCKVRYFSDGVAIGGKGFVEGVFEDHRGHFGEKRKSGSRKMKYADWGEVYTLRDLQVEPVAFGQ